ncbi:P-loop containing nucleoside triphosphate hydrolase protein [Meredithblackwellia eburnea MCA 4105]
MSPHYQLKLLCLGSRSCGKTALMSVVQRNYFPEVFVPAVFEVDKFEVNLEGETFEMSLWDTFDREEYYRLRFLSYPETDVVMICYSIQDPMSLEDVVNKWAPEARQFLGSVPIVLVGLKLDLRDNERAKNQLAETGNRILQWEDGDAVKRKIGAELFIECSAKRGPRDDLRRIFREAAQMALGNSKKKAIEKKRSKGSGNCVMM